MVSAMVVERQSGEIAQVKSRGASRLQVLGLYGFQSLLIAVLGLALGPLLAAIGVALLGVVPTFESLTGGSLLTVHLSWQAYSLAVVGAALSIAALMLPALRASRLSIVQHRQQAARQTASRRPNRYLLDAVLIIAAAFLFWRTQQQSVVSVTITGERQSDPLLLLSPAIFTLTVALVFLRLFPLVINLCARLVSR